MTYIKYVYKGEIYKLDAQITEVKCVFMRLNRSKKVNAYEATNGVVKKTKKALETEGPKRPMSSLDVYIVKYCSTKDMDPKSFSRTAWRDAYNELKESKRIRHIRAAITVSK